MEKRITKYIDLGTAKQDLPDFDRTPILNWDTPVTVDSQHAQRSLALHFLYTAGSQDHQIELDTIVQDYQDVYGLVIEPASLAFSIAEGVIASKEALDAIITPALKNWDLKRLGMTTLIILRMAIWESLNKKTDRTIIIDESIELAKGFADDKAGSFVNGLLDKILTQ